MDERFGEAGDHEYFGRRPPMSHAPGPAPKEMLWVQGGTFRMGSDDWYPEERPVRTVSVDGFWMDEHPVTVAEFRRFVRATRYVPRAERELDPSMYPRADPALLVPGALVVRRSEGQST